MSEHSNSTRRVLGEEHPDTLVSAWNLLETLQQLEDRESARRLLSNSPLGRLPVIPDESCHLSYEEKVRGRIAV